MKKLNIEDAIEVLENASAVIVDGDWLCYPDISGIDAVNWLTLYDVNNDTYYNFSDDADPTINANGELVLVDTEGDKIELRILDVKKL